MSSVLALLYTLLQKGSQWKWGLEQDNAFHAVKSQLTSGCLLVHFDPQKPLILACDASLYGVSAVMSHRLKDGSERLIAFASRSLSPAEKGYAQQDKEAVAIVFGVTKFHVYLCGHAFTIYSDHKPLQTLVKLWLQLEYSIGHYFLVRISIQFLTSRDLRWPAQMY